MPTQWYTVARLSDRMEFTPEGYLLIRNVPVARTGAQLYREGEILDIDGDENGWIKVERDPSEVFNPDSMASFQGKPIVNDHPFMMVDPSNYSDLAIGHMTDPHRGENSDHDLLLMDLLFTTQKGIDLVRSGKRALSVGYQALYDRLGKGYGRQRNIVCNHVALVDEGRCGARCTILDGKHFYNPFADHDNACGCDACRASHQPTENHMSKRTLKEMLATVSQAAFFAKDKAALDKIVADAEHEEPDGDEGQGANNTGGVHVHIAHGNGQGDGKTKDNDDDTEKRLKGCEDGIKAIDAKLGKLFDHLKIKASDNNGDDDKNKDKDGDKTGDNAGKTRDEGGNGGGGDDDKNKDNKTGDQGTEGAQTAHSLAVAEPELMEADPALKTGPSMMGDSAFVDHVTKLMPTLLQDLRARAEILSPGIQMPTLDAKPGKATQEGICALRRSALVRALDDEKGKKAIAGSYTADSIKAMSCDAVRMLFNDASKRMYEMNNGTVSTHNPDNWRQSHTGMVTYRQAQAARLTAINKQNSDFWAKQMGRPN